MSKKWITMTTSIDMPKHQRANDIFLMEVIAKRLKNKNKTFLEGVNRCRLYLQVICLSYITTGD